MYLRVPPNFDGILTRYNIRIINKHSPKLIHTTYVWFRFVLFKILLVLQF